MFYSSRQRFILRTVIYDGNEYEDISAKAIREAVYKVLGLEESNNDKKDQTCCCIK